MDILNLAHNVEQKEKAEHPLNRLMKIQERGGLIRLETTDMHLAKRIGEAVRHAHKGRLNVGYEPETHFVRVKWVRK